MSQVRGVGETTVSPTPGWQRLGGDRLQAAGPVALGLGRASAAVTPMRTWPVTGLAPLESCITAGIRDKHIRGVLELKPWLVSMPVSGAPGYFLTVSVVVAVNAFRKLDAVAVLTGPLLPAPGFSRPASLPSLPVNWPSSCLKTRGSQLSR